MDLQALDRIINETVKIIEGSKEQILEIADNAQSEVDRVKAELYEVAQETQRIIEEVDQLTILERRARVRLMEVSRDFSRYTEQDIKASYENAQSLQIKLITLREQEKTLRFRREHTERSQKRLLKTRQRAEALVSQVGVVLNYLRGDLVDLSGRLEDAMEFQKMRVQIIQAMEEERLRIAREIHDGPAQSMANLVLRSEFCSRMLDRDPDKIPDELAMLQGLVRACLKDVRKIIFDLRPMVLDDLGLVPAVKKYIEHFRDQHGLKVELVVFGKVDRLHRILEVSLFRIIQECLNNVSKHAEARSVVVRLELTKQRINLLVRDDGRGFDVEETMGNEKGERYGLVGLRERVRLLDGRLRIISKAGTGTTIILSAPVSE